jgi:GntR family transcriptional regulator
MFTKINYSSQIPIYVQIKNQIKYLIATGTLKGGDKLISVRELAIQLKINPTSTARAYRDLEVENILITKRGRGSFVSENVNKLKKSYRMQTILEETKKLISLAYQMGITTEELSKLFEQELSRIN